MTEPCCVDELADGAPSSPATANKVVLDGNGHICEDVARRVIRFIATYRREHRQGPTWGELATHMDWGREERFVALHVLRAHRIVYFTSQPRSLQLHARLRPPRQRRAATPEGP